MAILNHGSTLRTADGGQTTTTIVTAANIGTYGVATNATYYVGTTQNVFNRASGAQTLTGVSIDGNAATVTTNANLTGHITSVGNATSLGSFTSAQLLAALTDETGTGANVFATSPTLVTPALGTPSSGNLANCTFPTLNQNTTGTSSNITAYTINQNVGTGNAPSFTGMTSTAMLISSTSLTNGDDWSNSPISIRERGLVSAAQSINAYSPNLNFHWASRISNSLWMDANGNLAWGSYSETGVPSSDGAFYAANLYTSIYYDKNDTAYYLDAGNTGTSLLVAGKVGIGTTSPGYTLTVNGTIASIPSAGNPIFIGNDGTYGASGTGRYVALGFGGLANSANKIFAHNMGEDGLYICSATSRSIYFRAGGGAADHVVITSGGNLGVATNAADANLQVVGHVHVGNQTTFENAGGWNKTIYLDGTYHARLRILGSAYASGKNSQTETYLWVDNTVSPYSGLVTNAGSFTINAGFTTLTGSARSPIFYDSDNTAYYIDAASTSNLVGLTVANTITGSVSGNAGTATVLQTARNINGTSFNGSAAITTATWGTARTLTIGSTGKSVDGSAGVSWSLAEIGALPLSGGQITGNTTFSADNHLTFGPNSTWGSSIRIGGNGYTATGTETASVCTTDGNLHLDGAKSTNGIYLNWYGGTSGVFFGNGSSGQVAFVSNAGNASFSGVVDATQFRDASNTGYYLDPASTSILDATRHNSIVAGSTSGMSNGGAIAVYSGGSPYISFHDGTTARTAYFQEAGGGFYFGEVTYTESEGSFRAPLFYDSNNTAYYLDPASTSNLNNLTVAGTMTFGTLAYVTESRRSKNSSNVDIETVTGLVSPSGPTFLEIRGFCPPTMYRTTADRPAPYGLGFGNGSESGGIMPIGAGDNLQEIMLYGSNTGPTTFTFKRQNWEGSTYDPSNSNSYSASVFSINTGTGVVTASTDIRSPIFYDSNDTTYYIDPANGGFNLRGGTSNRVTFNSGDSGIIITNAEGISSNVRLGCAWGRPGIYNGSSITVGAETQIDFVIANIVKAYIDSSSNLFSNGSVRSPIFYDSNNTAYYIDAASTSILNNLRAATISAANHGLTCVYYGGGATPTNGYLITTNIDYSTFNMPTVIIEGYAYGNGVPIHLEIVWYAYLNSWTNLAYTNLGNWNPGTVSIGTNASGKVCLHLSNLIYYGRFNVRCIYDQGNAPLEGWTVTDATTSALTRVTTISKVELATSITGNSATTTLATKATRANGNFYIDDNHGNTVVGLYSASRYQGVYAMGDSYKLVADGSTTGNLYGIAWSHPNAGGAAGNLSDHGALVLLNGGYAAAISSSIRCTADMRTPIYYDSTNTAYYCDPNGVSNLYGVAIRGDVAGANTDNQIFFWGTGNGTTSAIGFKSNSGVFTNPTGNGDGYNTYLTMDTDGRGWVFRRGVGGTDFTSAYTAGWILNNGIWQANASMRAPIFYDSNDTAYYLDPRSASVLSGLKLNGIDNDAAGNTSDAILWINKPNNNDWGIRVTGNLEYLLKLEGATSHSYNIQGLANGSEFWRCGTDLLYHNSNIRAPIFYDSDNTAYYLNPNSTTSLRTVGSWRSDSSTWDGEFSGKIQYHSNHWYFQSGDLWIFRNSGGTNVATINQSGVISAAFSGSLTGNITGNVTGTAINIAGSGASVDAYGTIAVTEPANASNYSYYGLTRAGVIGAGFGITGTTGALGLGANAFWFGSATSTAAGVMGSAYIAFNGSNLVAVGTADATQFRDKDDTTYYVDPAGTSNLNKLSTFTMSYNDMNSMHTQSPYVTRYNQGAPYRNGTMGSGTTDCNVMFSNWGSGFIDSWSSPANAPGGSTHYVGLQAFHYNHQNSVNAYGFQMLCAGEADNRFFWRSAWPTLRSWVEMIHTGNYNSYSPTLTGANASGTWSINVTGNAGGSSASCTGNAASATTAAACTGNAATVTNGMYLSGDQFISGAKYFTSNKGAASTVGANATYSLEAYSSDAGAAGMSFHRGGYYAVNMGLDPDNIFRIGGWSASANRLQLDMSGNLTLAGVVDATQFRDSNNTAYYIDAASTSNLAGLTVANTITGSISGSSGSCTGNAANVTGTVAVANGGTGATSTAAAAANLGLGTGNTPKFLNVFGERVALNSASPQTINTQYNITELTLVSSISTLTFSNIQASGVVHMWTLVTVGNATAYTITWPAAVKWPGGTAPTVTTTNTKRDIYQFVTYDGGTNIYAIIVGQNL